ncbi:regulator of chromosome condensation 1/beta-lactamase-inhibitor protein II [Xylogone sp. PMI_703]|nr:regulator of chromosome condensation 1/beta-lactamase-inhibitor protein II [Xylogone sp. PMI_703]
MELWASGLNTWGQLGFDHTEEPINLKTFQRILTDRKIEILHTSIYATVALIDGVIYEYENISAWLQGRGRRLNHIQNAEHIISYRTGFAVLTTDGQVWTWGDLRYGPCLGREIDDKSEAAEPGLVESLLDLPTGPIVKISGSGYVLAALTSGNDLYVWGGRAGEVPYLDDLSAIASPVDIDHDILDMAVGDRHLIVLTTSSEVFVIGDNGWGQLALSLSAIENWQEIPLPFDDGREVVGVHASYKTSFLLVKNTHSTMQS